MKRPKGRDTRKKSLSKTPLRQDIIYLRCIVREAISLYYGQTPEDRINLAALQDYLILLAKDALQDIELARRLAPTLSRLQEELHAEAESRRARHEDPTPHAYYQGYLGALENTLNHAHETDLILHEQITRRQFQQHWEQTRKTLGL